MNLFAWLIVGHLVGDWLLQTDWMARRKRLRLVNPAVLVHCALYTLAVACAIWLSSHLTGVRYSNLPGAVALVFASHWLIDAGNQPRLWGRLVGQSDFEFVRMMVDQTMHVIVLSLLAEILI
jgi:hypothetical protein